MLATTHGARDLEPPSTIKILSKPGAIVLERRNTPVLALVLIPLALFIIVIMGVVFAASGLETLPFAVPLVLVSLVGIGFGIRSLRYRQMLSLERGVLTVTERPSWKGTITARDIEQLVISAKHSTHWHRGLRWHARYELHAQTRSGSVLVLSGFLEEVRFVEATFEGELGIADDASRNTVTVA